MAALGLCSYASDASSDDEDEQPPYPLSQPVADAQDGAEGSDEEEVEEAPDAEEEVEDEAGPVVPLALLGAADDDDDEEEDAQAPAAEEGDEDSPSGLPAPDFSDWPWDPENGRTAQPAGPQITALGKRERPKGGTHQISRGFSAAVTRHDQLKAKAEADLEKAAEDRGRNNGLSSAYDSVFHVPEGSMTEDELERQKRMRTTRKGGVRMISKKELAKEQALEASLM